MTRQHALSRTELLLGKEALETLRKKCVAVLGVGGVGSYSVEALARCGIGRLLIVDDDTVCISNINRQLHATPRTVGRKKVEVMKERVAEIDPKITVDARYFRVTAGNVPELFDVPVDYVIDALDTISAKIALAEHCFHHAIPIISCMGAGNKLDPAQFAVADLYKTRMCPLAKVMRAELKKRNVTRLKVVYSEEMPRKMFGTHVPARMDGPADGPARREKRNVPASISFVPPVAGFILAGEAVKDLVQAK